MATSWNLESEEATSTVESDGKVVNEYVQAYLYKTTAMTRPTPADIVTDLGILPGSPFYEDTHATCYKSHISGATAKTRPPYLAYLITLNWATNAPLPISTSTDPTTRRTIWSVRPVIQQRFVIRDNTDNLIVNTAGQPFDGGIPVDVRLGTVIATRNVTAVGYNKATVLAYSGQLNSVVYLGGAIGTVQVDIESNEKFEGAYHYWEEVYTFTYDPRGHQPKPASSGFYQRSAIGSNNLVRIRQGGEDVMEPEPLDANGILAPISGRPGNCAFVTVPYFQSMDFNGFGL
jgi:hypothetical protein